MKFDQFKQKFQKKSIKVILSNSESKPLVSVCIQTFNHAPYIEKCLEGVLMQKTDFPFEIWVGEDNSTDGTREICLDYAQKYPDKINLVLHSRENNIKIHGTPTGRFNFSYNLYSSRGKYIAVCEGDDFWTDPYKLQKQADFLERNSQYVISFHDCKIIDQHDKVIEEGRIKNESNTRNSEELVTGSHLPTNTILFKNLFKEYPCDFFEIKNADTFIFAMLGHHGSGIYQKDIQKSMYRVHSGGMWSSENKRSKMIQGYFTFQKILNNSDRKFHKAINRKLMSISYRLMRYKGRLSDRLKYSCHFFIHSLQYMIGR